MLINAAFERIKQLEILFGDDIPWQAIEQGFKFEGEKVFLANKARGIFKPKQLARGVVSIKTTMPRPGRTNIYADKEMEEGFFRYSLQRGDPKSGGNKYLWEALEDRLPLVYFHAVAEGIYKALWPCFIAAINREEGYCEVIVSTKIQTTQSSSIEYAEPTEFQRRYAVRESKIRLHQAAFRAAVLAAYNYRCAISGFPIVRLLEAAHIIPDSESNSSAAVTNGITLSKIHHHAYDANLLGISPDFQIMVSEQLLQSKDGLLLDALLNCHSQNLTLPKTKAAQPNREGLASRYENFLKFSG